MKHKLEWMKEMATELSISASKLITGWIKHGDKRDKREDSGARREK